MKNIIVLMILSLPFAVYGDSAKEFDVATSASEMTKVLLYGEVPSCITEQLKDFNFYFSTGKFSDLDQLVSVKKKVFLTEKQMPLLQQKSVGIFKAPTKFLIKYKNLGICGNDSKDVLGHTDITISLNPVGYRGGTMLETSCVVKFVENQKWCK